MLEEGFQKNSRSAALAVPAAGLSTLHVDPAIRAIEDGGGTVSLRTRIERIEVEDGRVASLLLRDGERRSYDACVSAIAPWRLLSLLPEELRAEGSLAALARFRPAPILNLHLWFDRPVADFPFAAFIRSEVQWAFNRSRVGGEDETGRQHLVISISAPAEEFFPLPREQVCARVLPQLREALPAARDARLVHYRVMKEPEATLRARAGPPPPRTGHPAPQPLPRRLVHGYGLARHHGIGRSQRPRSGRGSGGRGYVGPLYGAAILVTTESASDDDEAVPDTRGADNGGTRHP